MDQDQAWLAPAPKALQDVTVVELSTGVGGAYCTRLLAGLGAEVVKIEDSEVGTALHVQGSSESAIGALYHHLNSGKKSVSLNLESPSGQEVLEKLIGQAEIVVEDRSTRSLASVSLGYSSLAANNPRLVMTTITWFGQEGPFSDYEATDLICLAMGGMLSTCGERGGRPTKVGGMQAQYLAGLNAAIATLAAQLHAEVSGKGQCISISVMESVASAVEAPAIGFSCEGLIPQRQGNRHGHAYPMTVLPCKDGYVAVMLPTDSDWDLFSRLTGIVDLQDEKFHHSEDRLRLADEIEAKLKPYLLERTREELFTWAQELRLPFSMVLTPPELLSDPQHVARGFFAHVEHPAEGRVLQVGGPFRMSGTPWHLHRAPLPGEHTHQVLSERLGLGDDELWALKQERAI